MHHRHTTHMPNVFRNCLETYIERVTNSPPEPTSTPHPDDCTVATIDRDPHDHDEWHNNLAENEYQQTKLVPKYVKECKRMAV